MATKSWCRIRLNGGEDVYGTLIADGSVRVVEGLPWANARDTDLVVQTGDYELLLPVFPRVFYAVGANYRSHIDWANSHHGMSIKVPARPEVGFRSPSAIIGPDEPIVIPVDSPGPIEFEGELVAVIGKVAKHLTVENALEAVWGYTLGNDLTDRTWQRQDKTNWRYKNMDSSKPMGPVVVSGLDPMSVTVEVAVNGRAVSSYATSGMIFRLEEYLAVLTRYVTLWPGDVIWLGTDGATVPALKGGDVVEVSSPEIGVLRNPVVRAGE